MDRIKKRLVFLSDFEAVSPTNSCVISAFACSAAIPAASRGERNTIGPDALSSAGFVDESVASWLSNSVFAAAQAGCAAFDVGWLGSPPALQ